jgi:hypothetical protein
MKELLSGAFLFDHHVSISCVTLFDMALKTGEKIINGNVAGIPESTKKSFGYLVDLFPLNLSCQPPHGGFHDFAQIFGA